MSDLTSTAPLTTGRTIGLSAAADGGVFAGPGEMRALCRAFDWSASPLGPPAAWSQSLRTTVGIVLSSSNPMFLWWGPNLVQIYNDAYRPSLGEGGRHPRALGAFGQTFWTDIWNAIGPQIEQVMTTGESPWHEDQYLPIERNGRVEDVWWTYSYIPVRDDDGRIAGTLVVCQETTRRVLADLERERLRGEKVDAARHTARILEQASDERVTMEGELHSARMVTESAQRDGEARYRALFESLDEGFCVIEVLFGVSGSAVDYRFVETNAAFDEQTGLTDSKGRTARELVPNLESHWFETYGRVASTGMPTRFESGSDAMGRWFDVYAFRVGRPDERTVAILFKDITASRAAAQERERLVRALELERSRLAYVFQHAPAFLAVVRGPEHVLELANEAYYQMVGYRDMLGKSVGDALPEVRDQGFIGLLDGVLASGTPYVGREVPIVLARTPGALPEERFVDFVYLPLAEADGTRSGVIAHGTDVTDHVRARREIELLYTREQEARTAVEEAYAVAEAANRAKAEFLAVMSHELRTPLNAIGGYAELMEMGIRGPVTAQQREDLRRVQMSQRHLLGLINEVLNYAKLETGTVQYDLIDVPLREAMFAAESLVNPQTRTKGLTLVVVDCSPALAARADAEKLRQILINLLSNAVKFTDSGGRIEMSAHAADGTVSIVLADTGIGIPPDKLDSIFDPFVQVRADLTRPNEGTGLGLAISRDLARGMGGNLTATSTSGEGSRFTLTLPRA